MGAVHLRRGTPALAAKCLERALLLRGAGEGSGGEADRTLAATLSSLGSARQALGAHSEALRCRLAAVGALERAGGEDAALAGALHALGGAHRAVGQAEEALRCYERALQLRERVTRARLSSPPR
ncbi:unnamed protein product [Prorocentrum cordatum]|uniref:Kinesin light chain n=1 Tax=Prorocentrum cordatum TaxID=2364126 RepID=A0ABN9VKT8_9DINO|nr:unnamed protein product [Polarella glacialis]